MKTDFDARFIHVAILVGCIRVAESYSIRDPAFSQPTRACGHKLAEVLSLVCKNGYYQYFATPVDSSDSYRSGRRSRRGIVDECCHSGCSVHTLEQYCIPPTTEAPDNSQIRKRSDNDKSWQEPFTKEENIMAKLLHPNFPHHRYDNFIKQENSWKEMANETREPMVEEDSIKDRNLIFNLILPKKDASENEAKVEDRQGNELVGNQAINENQDMLKPLKRFSALHRLVSREKESVDDVEKNNLHFGDTEQSSNDHRMQPLDFNPHGEKIRHHTDKHHYIKTGQLLMKTNYQETDLKPKSESRSVVSRVGIEDEYFLNKESVHPKLMASLNFARHNSHST